MRFFASAKVRFSNSSIFVQVEQEEEEDSVGILVGILVGIFEDSAGRVEEIGGTVELIREVLGIGKQGVSGTIISGV